MWPFLRTTLLLGEREIDSIFVEYTVKKKLGTVLLISPIYLYLIDKKWKLLSNICENLQYHDEMNLLNTSRVLVQ